MTDTPATSNDDLLLATIANDGVPPVPFDVLNVPAPPEGVLSPAEFTHTEVLDPVIHDADAGTTTGGAPLRTDGPTIAEFTAAGYPADTYPPQGYAPKADDQHADSGYRPVGGAEVQDYMRAKSMGMQGRPSREQVIAFLASKGA